MPMHYIYAILTFIGSLAFACMFIALLVLAAKDKDPKESKGQSSVSLVFLVLAIGAFFYGKSLWSQGSGTTAQSVTAPVTNPQTDTTPSTDDLVTKAKDYVKTVKSDPNLFSLPIVDASVNPNIDGQLWVQVVPGHSDAQLEQLGKEVSRDYHHEVGFIRSDVMVVEDKPKVDVVFDATAGNYEVKLQ